MPKNGDDILNNKINLVYKKVGELIPYENNPRNNDEAVDYVANSINEFGFKVPIIIDKNNVIIAGHTRLKAILKSGGDKNIEIPCIIADDLTEEQIKAFRLADNKVSEFSKWNTTLLDEELEQLKSMNMEDFGFDEHAFDEALDIDIPTDEQRDKDKHSYICPKCGFEFEV